MISTMTPSTKLAIAVAELFIFGSALFVSMPERAEIPKKTALAAKFEELVSNGNSTCSAEFYQSIDTLTAGERIKGPCCSPIDFHRYE